VVCCISIPCLVGLIHVRLELAIPRTPSLRSTMNTTAEHRRSPPPHPATHGGDTRTRKHHGKTKDRPSHHQIRSCAKSTLLEAWIRPAHTAMGTCMAERANNEAELGEGNTCAGHHRGTPGRRWPKGRRRSSRSSICRGVLIGARA
jgi:hypothetical protein